MRGKRVVNRQSDCGWMRCHCVILALCVAGSALSTVSCEDKDAATVRLKVAQVHELVTVGMDIEQAVDKIEKKNIPVRGPWDDGAGSYALVQVHGPVEYNVVDGVAKVLRLGDGNDRFFVVITSDESGRIVHIHDPQYWVAEE